jgi:hypothetical protein
VWKAVFWPQRSCREKLYFGRITYIKLLIESVKSCILAASQLLIGSVKSCFWPQRSCREKLYFGRITAAVWKCEKLLFGSRLKV